MDKDTKVLFGKLLGEIYRVQKRMGAGICPTSDAGIYGLLHGLETVIDEEIESVGFVSSSEFDGVVEVLNEVWKDPEKLAAFKGFYDVEGTLQSRGIARWTAIKVLRYLANNGQFAELIAKMDSSDSPSEARTFKLDRSFDS